MIFNFLKIALRNLLKRKFHSFINIFGLALGMAATILIASYVFFETSYDTFHENFSDLYRIQSKIFLPSGESVEGPVTLGNVAPQLVERIPEISKSVRFMSHRERQIEYNNIVFTNDQFMWADSGFFDVFSFEPIAGDLKTALVEKNSLVITERLAKTIFGEEEAFHQVVKCNGENYKITAVIKDVPINAHFHFDMLGSFSTICNAEIDVTKDDGFNFFTYLVCQNFENNKTLIQAKTDTLINEIANDRFGDMGLVVHSHFQPLKDIHLHSNSTFELESNGNIYNIYIFSVLALFIIMIAVVNFINLVTANSETRAKEIGLRKVMGAFRANLFRQFIGESILTSVFAFLVALGITELCIDMFRSLMDSPIPLPYWSSPALLLLMLIIVMVVGFFAGSYPATYLSRYLPVQALKGSKSSGGAKNTFLRKSLVVFQFSIAIFLLVNLSLLHKQVKFMKNKDLGFDKEQILVVEKFTHTISNSYQSLKADLLSNPNILSVTASEAVPGELGNLQAAYEIGSDPDASIAIHETRIQDDFVETFGIKIVEGNDFDNKMGTASTKVIINQAAVKKLALKNPISSKINLFGDTLQIIGVMQDYHFQSLHEKIAPHMLSKQREWFSYISIKLNTKDISKTIRDVETTFSNIDKNNTFDYSFIDQKFEQMYRAEERSNQLITYAAILAIIISMLGLFALTSFTMNQKIKEIGVRKVMGASVYQIAAMFITDLTKWVIVAAVIAFPLAWYSMEKWLENFDYQTNISIWMFLFGGILAFVIAVATVSFISIKAAHANPIDSLKYE